MTAPEVLLPVATRVVGISIKSRLFAVCCVCAVYCAVVVVVMVMMVDDDGRWIG